MNFGATVVRICIPDKNGKLGDVALGFGTFTPYLTQSPYFGAIVGRYGNRIANGHFELDGKGYQLAKNNGPNSLHGGLKGFDKQLWKAAIVKQDPPTLRFSLISPDGQEGYPGTLSIAVTYSFNDANELKISYEATTDKATVLNLTNHTYFNLAGEGSGTVLKQVIAIHADKFTPVNSTLIPTGELKDVSGTAWDLRSPTPIGKHIDETGGTPVGYDHNFVLNKGLTDWSTAAEVYDPKSGRTLKVLTDQPGLQFYSGNFFDGTLTGKSGKIYVFHGAFCLETQHFPDSPNHPDFPSTVLRPGEIYRSTTVDAFGVK